MQARSALPTGRAKYRLYQAAIRHRVGISGRGLPPCADPWIAVTSRHGSRVRAMTGTRRSVWGRRKSEVHAGCGASPDRLEQALALGSADLFADYVDWAQTMLSSRGLPESDLAKHLRILVGVVTEHHVPYRPVLVVEIEKSGHSVSSRAVFAISGERRDPASAVGKRGTHGGDSSVRRIVASLQPASRLPGRRVLESMIASVQSRARLTREAGFSPSHAASHRFLDDNAVQEFEV